MKDPIHPDDVMKAMFLFLVIALVGISMSIKDAKASACRNPAVKHKFDVQQGYPHGHKGYIVDHICALVQGGIDDPKNMQYQTILESHKKDRIENTDYGRALFCTPDNSTPTRQVFNCKDK